MNRPSRTEDDLVHPTWNQSPPFLAPDLTTCADLNGTVNSRELKDASGGSIATFALSEKSRICPDSDNDADDGVCLRLEIVPTQERLRRLYSQLSTSQAWSWTWWIASVLVTSFVMSSIVSPSEPRVTLNHSVTDIPVRALYKRDRCEEGGVSPEDYDVPLHVGALFIVMFVSTVACGFPVLAKKFPALRIPPGFFFAVRHFGTGVLIATAFVHLLPTAFLSLGDPCLSTFWTEDYPAMPGAIALMGVFFVLVVEMVFSPARHFSHCRAPTSLLRSPTGGPEAGNRSLDSLQTHQTDTPGELELSITPQRAARPGQLGGDDANKALGAVTPAKGVHVSDSQQTTDLEVFSSHYLTKEQKVKKEVLQCVLLEIGILFHSVFIGMALSVAVGNSFVVLLIAIVFHQAFEGLALGSRIASIDWSSYPNRPWLMAIAYGLTTPIGQAIGIATHTLYNPGSSFGLVLVGTMNSISAGLLVYASLVELLAVDFLSDESWNTLRGTKRIVACVVVFAGAFCMALVGAWA